MIKKLAALGIAAALAFAPVIAMAEDAVPPTDATSTSPAGGADTSKTMSKKPMKMHKMHKMHKMAKMHKMKKMEAPKTDTPPADAPKT